MLKGITVKLYEKTMSGVDALNKPTYTETAVEVDNVLVAPMSANEILDTLNLTGKRGVYQLGIPKGDTHDWEDSRVEFFGQEFRTFGKPLEGIDCLLPLDWNKKVTVEIYG